MDSLLVKQHFLATKKLAENLKKKDIAQWLLTHGYYPEAYALPPCFSISKYPLHTDPVYKTDKIKTSSIQTISFQKKDAVERTFGVIHPDIYHDMAHLLQKNWDNVVAHIFSPDRRIYSYSFPVPLTASKKANSDKNKRQERLIYEYIEMAEKLLVADSASYDYVVHADIRQFFASIHTPSIGLALNGSGKKKKADNGLAERLDQLITHADGKHTQGIPVGPIISDIIAEIILSAVDREVSHSLDGLDILGIRFKDDYKILCKSESDAKTIIEALRKTLKKYSLGLNDEKTKVERCPAGLYRHWIQEYQPFSLKGKNGKSGKKKIKFPAFENSYLKTLEIDSKYSDKGIIDKLLGELVNHKNRKLRVSLVRAKDQRKFIAMIWRMAKHRPKSYASALGILEEVLYRYPRNIDYIKDICSDELALQADERNYHTLCWLWYFIKTNNLRVKLDNELKKDKSNVFWQSMMSNSPQFFNDSKNGISLYTDINKCKAKYGSINNNVILFGRPQKA